MGAAVGWGKGSRLPLGVGEGLILNPVLEIQDCQGRGTGASLWAHTVEGFRVCSTQSVQLVVAPLLESVIGYKKIPVVAEFPV